MRKIGASSLLVIFSVLCLTVFALLALSTVQAERRMADASLQAVTAYYSADSRAEEIFAALRIGEIPESVPKTGNQYTYSCPISEHQTLEVELEKTPEGWQILRWQAVASAPAAEGDLPSVWNGE